MADAKKLLNELDEWMRSRIRGNLETMERIRTRFENIKKAGVSKEQAWMWANTRKGYWRIAHSPILAQSQSNEQFKRVGYS